MTRGSVRKEGFSLLGVSIAACVACCAGPILGVLGGIGVAGLASTVVVGATGLVIAAVAASAFVLVRRRRVRQCADTDVVPVQLLTRKT